jgi:hypothetical protein
MGIGVRPKSLRNTFFCGLIIVLGVEKASSGGLSVVAGEAFIIEASSKGILVLIGTKFI